ncbi:hypothetical protein FM107_13870 [Sphingobacterium sp. JB170]|nr:hypothetical protein FM107_13870 [Sphingobacterium sp. JB170]
MKLQEVTSTVPLFLLNVLKTIYTIQMNQGILFARIRNIGRRKFGSGTLF